MVGRGRKLKVTSTALAIVLSLSACGSPESDPTGKARAQALEEQAQTQEQKQLSRTLNELIENFREGSTPPQGWPTDLIPVPEGAKPVASLQRSVLPNGAETMSMFYASPASPEDVQRSFRNELPRKGWVEVQPAADGEITIVTAENDIYNGLFMAGRFPSVPPLESGEIINVLVVVTTPGSGVSSSPPIP